jgi:hypothetical protein
MGHRDAKTDRRAIIKDIKCVAIEAQCRDETFDDPSEIIERIVKLPSRRRFGVAESR